MSTWGVYWLTRMDGISDFFTIIFWILVIMAFIVVIMGPIIDAYNEISLSIAKKIIKIYAAIWAISAIGLIFIPTTKQLAAIYLIPKLTQNEQIQKMPDNVAKLLNVKMEAWIADTLKEGNEGKKENITGREYIE